LLAHGDEPIILDQPEDDLDNELIYELIVRQLRANKSRRQVVIVTHNPNIVVNGDAELIIVMGSVAGQCRVLRQGSLQLPEVRASVCDVMEGGREALERRYRRMIDGDRHV
jgi:ABC-type lipoprotein export system ATPase subunit